MIQDFTLASRMGVGWRTKWLLASSLVGWRHQERIPLFKLRLPPKCPLALQDHGKPFQLWLSSCAGQNEMLIFWEIFGSRVYDLQLSWSPKVILDLGSYTGISPLYFRLRYPQARILCVEPDPDNYARLCRNTDSLPGIERLCCAVASTSGPRKLYLSPTQTCGHSLYQADSPCRSVEVQCVTLDELIRRFRVTSIDILKFDVEGAEWEIFRNYSFPVPVLCLIGELHLDPDDEKTFCRQFVDNGYDVSISKDDFVGVTMFRALKTSSQSPG